MDNWQEDMLDMLVNINGLDELAVFQHIKKVAQALGFEYVAYGLRLPLPITSPKIITLNSYPPSWQARYQQENYLSVDPTVLHGLRSCKSLVWSQEVFRFTPDLWDEAQAAGLNFGWSQSSLDSLGLIGMLSLARSIELISASELAKKETRMRWLAQMAHTALSRELINNFNKQEAPQLTTRETEVLKWTADGKSAEDIADILNISVNTVNFHIKNLTIKLKASNKTAAVLRAAMFGLLHKP
jgi:DNA-binding CsgD family transcriptional regulator